MTVREMLNRAARWFPKNEAAVDEISRLSYAELLDKARRCAALYHDLGVRKGDRVALLLYPSAVHCIAYFAAVELGAIPVALHVRESPETLSAVTKRLAPRVLVYDEAVEETALRLSEICSTITGKVRAYSAATRHKSHDRLSPAFTIPDDLDGYSADLEPMPVYEHDPVTIVLSSGTTGIPKGIVHTNRTFMESARGGVYWWNGIKHSDAILNTLTTSFIGWYNLSLPFFNVGAKNVFLGRWDAKEILDALEREKVTKVLFVPTMWRMLLREGVEGYDLSSIQIASFAGEVMDPTTLQRIREQVCSRVVNIYATTETGSLSAGTVLFEEDMTPERLPSVGKPLLNSDLRVIEPGGTAKDELPRGEAGEVIIRGPSVASSVWDDPATAERIFDGSDPWWHSGDRGYLDEEGFLFLEGRIDDMIISGGINVNPARVEEVLLSHPDVAECAVIGVPDPEWGQRIRAYLVPKRKDLSTEDLDRFLRESPLSNYQRPRSYVFTDQLPRTASGKLSRKLLREASEQASVVEAG